MTILLKSFFRSFNLIINEEIITKRRLFNIFLVVILLLMFNNISAQEEKKDDKKSKIGIGVIFHNLWQDLFYDGYIPTIFIPIDANDKLRIEPEFSYFRDKDKSDDTEWTTTRIRIGIGIFGKMNKPKTIIYYGLRLGYTHSTYKYEHSYYPYGTDSHEEKSKRFFFGPAVGGEYFFNSHFSLGCEVGFRYISLESEENVDALYNYDDESKIAGTKANIFLRFYF